MIKRFGIVAMALALGVTFALAQQPKEPEFKLTLTASDLQLLDRGVSSLPYKEVAPFIMKLQQQITTQANKPVEAPKPDTDKDK